MLGRTHPECLNEQIVILPISSSDAIAAMLEKPVSLLFEIPRFNLTFYADKRFGTGLMEQNI
jgi:hypothetical protein